MTGLDAVREKLEEIRLVLHRDVGVTRLGRIENCASEALALLESEQGEQWNTGVPDEMGWFLVWTLNESYDHLPTGWWRAWFDGKEWDKRSSDNPMPYHRVTHWMRIVGPTDAILGAPTENEEPGE